MSRYLSARILASFARILRSPSTDGAQGDDAAEEGASAGEAEPIHQAPSSSHIRAAKPLPLAEG